MPEFSIGIVLMVSLFWGGIAGVLIGWGITASSAEKARQEAHMWRQRWLEAKYDFENDVPRPRP